MSFRRRMVLLAAGAVAAAVVLASVVVYVVTRDELLGQIDTSLRQKLIPGQPQSVQVRATNVSPAEMAKLQREGRWPPEAFAQIAISPSTGTPTVLKRSSSGVEAARGGKGLHTEILSIQGKSTSSSAPAASAQAQGVELDGLAKLVLPTQTLGGATGYVQLIQSDGRVLRSEDRGSLLPVTAAARAVATGRRPAFFGDTTVASTHVRVLTERAPQGGVWQVALPLTDVDSTLTHLQLVLALVSLGGVALAAALGLLVSRAALIPVRRLTGAAERVARTQDLGHRIKAGENDELGRLAASFNTMLAALERSRLAQRQLVSDASHELRTPLTSVWTNLDALTLGERLPAAERARIVAAVQAQLRELTVLVGDLVDLSKTDVKQIEVEDVRLDLATAEALDRAKLHAPECRFVLDVEPCLVRAVPARLDRAITNLLDNACKWNPPSPPGEPIVVRVRDGRLDVRDHGPGIAAEDLPRVFDRFYRAPAARARPGSGLGLAIVRQVAETHCGTVHAATEPNGGACLTLELPSLAMTAEDVQASAYESNPISGAVQGVPPLL